MISHELKWPKGGLGTYTGIPKEHYKWYQDFHDQKAERKEKKKIVTDELMMALTDNYNAAALMLTEYWKK